MASTTTANAESATAQKESTVAQNESTVAQNESTATQTEEESPKPLCFHGPFEGICKTRFTSAVNFHFSPKVVRDLFSLDFSEVAVLDNKDMDVNALVYGIMKLNNPKFSDVANFRALIIINKFYMYFGLDPNGAEIFKTRAPRSIPEVLNSIRPPGMVEAAKEVSGGLFPETEMCPELKRIHESFEKSNPGYKSHRLTLDSILLMVRCVAVSLNWSEMLRPVSTELKAFYVDILKPWYATYDANRQFRKKVHTLVETALIFPYLSKKEQDEISKEVVDAGLQKRYSDVFYNDNSRNLQPFLNELKVLLRAHPDKEIQSKEHHNYSDQMWFAFNVYYADGSDVKKVAEGASEEEGRKKRKLDSA